MEENMEKYWKLVNLLSDVCYNAMEEDDLYFDDVMSCLDRVKTYLQQEQIKLQIENEADESNGKYLESNNFN